MQVCISLLYLANYLCCCLASEGIVALVVTLCVCPPSCFYHVSTACRNSLGGEGNALYPVLSSYVSVNCRQFDTLPQNLACRILFVICLWQF